MKKICIVSNVIGNRDVIHTGENGFVCDSVDEYVDSIQNVENNKNTLLIENAYQDILCKYNTKTMADQYSKIYASSIKNEVKIMA